MKEHPSVHTYSWRPEGFPLSDIILELVSDPSVPGADFHDASHNKHKPLINSFTRQLQTFLHFILHPANCSKLVSSLSPLLLPMRLLRTVQIPVSHLGLDQAKRVL